MCLISLLSSIPVGEISADDFAILSAISGMPLTGYVDSEIVKRPVDSAFL